MNGPGGKVDDEDASVRAAMAREAVEEMGIEVDHDVPELRAKLRFTFAGAMAKHDNECHVFVAPRSVVRGEPRASAEMEPVWAPLDALPYDKMWPDDIIWLPRVLCGSYVEYAFEFDGDGNMTGHREIAVAAKE